MSSELNRTQLITELSVTSETADALGEHPWADLMRQAARMLKQDRDRIHQLNEQLLNVRADLDYVNAQLREQ